MKFLNEKIDNKEIKGYKCRFLIKGDKRYFSVEVNDVAYVFIKKTKYFIQTKSCEIYPINSNLDKLEIHLDRKMFFRANRQFIVNYDCIEKFLPGLMGN